MTQSIHKRLEQLNITLPTAGAPAANYLPFRQEFPFLFISGQLPIIDGKIAIKGKIGENLTVDDGVKAARLCGLQILAQAHAALGSLDRIVATIRLGGFVNGVADFSEHPKVINGASDLMVAVLGEAGKHTRFAVGAASLPLGAAVEIDAQFKIRET